MRTMSRSKLLTILALILLVAVPAALAQAQEEEKTFGTAVIWDDQSLSDAITYSLTDIPQPQAGTAYEGWLVSDDGSVKLSTGFMTVAADGSVSHTLKSAEAVLIALDEMNESGQSGRAVLTALGSQTQVEVTIGGGTFESELKHIHSGQCGDTLGGVVHGLTNIVGGKSTTIVDATLASLRNGDFAVNLHKKGEPGVYTACGNIPTEAESITIALNEQNDTGESGWATLTSKGAQTVVVLTVGPGKIESELDHIHSGQCGDTLGGVVHGLTDIAGGASMTTVDATLASLRNGDFAVNLHKKGAPAVYTACGNIPAGASFYTGENLIDTYDKVVITEEPVPDSDPGPSAVVLYSHQIPSGGIGHIRHLLTNWPPGADKGILTNLKEQLDVAIRHANLAKNSDTLDGVIQHTHHVINILEGENGPNYDISFGDPGDGVGAINHAIDRKHGPFAAGAAADDAVITAGAALVDITGKNAEDRATKARDIALDQVLTASTAGIAKIFLGPGGNTVVSELEAARNGFDTGGDGTIESIAGEGGAKQAYVEAQKMATYTLKAGPPEGVVCGYSHSCA